MSSTQPWPAPDGPVVTEDNFDEVVGRRPPEALKGGGLVLIALLAVAGLMGGFSILAVIAAFVVMIFLHELGHYLAARWAGMKATEFFLGFGPRIWSFRRGETEYGVKAIPLGAYVKVIGMTPLDEVPEADEPRTYRQARFRDRFNLAIAGSMMHFAQALILLFVLLAFVGLPKNEVWEIREVREANGNAIGPAAAAGLLPGDAVTAVDGVAIATWGELTEYVRDRPGETVELAVDRGGDSLTIPVTLGDRNPVTDEAVGFLGAAAELPLQTTPAHIAARDSFVMFGEFGVDVVQSVGRFFSPSFYSAYFERLTNEQPIDEETGFRPGDEDRPVSIVGAGRIADQAITSGWSQFLVFMVGMNLVVGVFNLLPMLPLDGGHAVVAVYEKVRSRKGKRYHADVRKLMPVAYGTVMVLGFIFLSSLWLDVTSPLPNAFGR
jgi:membrane-associated protease RseP (regulator of RpoE activity)